jgi:hypothetical protein
MKLHEAIKSGRPFQRRVHVGLSNCGPYASGTEWLRSFQLGEFENFDIAVDDILADDWEIQEPTVTITRTQLRAALERIYLSDPCEKLDPCIAPALERQLGLSES